MFAKLKKLDSHVKALDGVNQKTLLGSILTVVTVFVVTFLVWSEVSVFREIQVVSRMIVDKSVGVDAVKLEFDLVFPRVICDEVTFHQEVTRGTIHIKEATTKISKQTTRTDNIEGCRVSASFLTDKVGGHFRFGIPYKPNNGPIKEGQFNYPLFQNISHNVNLVSFTSTAGESAVGLLPDVKANISALDVAVPEGTQAYQYLLQVVPTQYKKLSGEVYHLNQYTFNEKMVRPEQAMALDPSLPRDFHGIIVTYDFHPVMLFMEEHRERIIDFISSLCGIVGGVITVLSLLERCLHQGSKALIGKKD